jgi:hypothetical protein
LKTHTHRASHGITELRFSTSLGTPVEGLSYRLRDARGRTRAGVTGADGAATRLLSRRAASAREKGDTWLLEGPAMLSLDVQRDDGSWTLIGSFQHEANTHKQVHVIAPAIAVPLQMLPI